MSNSTGSAKTKAELAVLERRLRPVYEALDSHNYKKALTEAEKILKKHPNTNAAKECHQHRKVVTLYERAIQIDPSEQNLTQLFMAYSRERMYKEQQKIGLRLFKDFGNAPYYYWSVMSLILQAGENPELGQKMLLPLADKMVKTQIEKSGVAEGAAELEIQLLILEGQEKWKECAEFVDKKEAIALPLAPYNLVEKGMSYYMKGGQYDKVYELASEAVEKMPDNWNLWKLSIESTVNRVEKLIESDKKEDIEEAQSLVKKLSELIEAVQKTVDYKIRSPYIAPFLAQKSFRQMPKKIPGMEDLAPLFGDYVEKMLKYVEHFYKKPVCYADLKMFFTELTEDQKTEFLKGMIVWIEQVSTADDESGDESKVWAIILIERCRRALGENAKRSPEFMRALFQQLIAQIAAKDRGEHAQGVLANFATSHLWEAYRTDNDLEKFYEMILILEYVVANNKTDPLCKLALMRAYADICATGRINALQKNLDIKAIQMDTLGHLTFPVYETSGHFNLAIIQNTQLMYMYDQADKEIQDCIAQAYRNGKFSAVARMTEVSNRMRNSVQKSACEVMNRYLSSLFVLEDIDQITITLWGEEDPIDWKSLHDTRDFNTLPYTETPEYDVLLEDMKQRTFKELIDISELRNTMCRALGAVGRITHENMDPRLARVQLKITVTEFKEHLEYCCREYPTILIPSKLAQSPAPQHLSQWVHSGGPQMILEYLEATIKLVEILDSGEHPDKSLVGTRTEMATKLIKLIDIPPKRTEGEPLPPFWIVEPIIKSSRALQTLATISILLQLIEKVVIKLAQNVPTSVPDVVSKAKGKKEKKAAEETIAKTLSECKAVVFLEHIRAKHVELRYAGNFLHSHFSQLLAVEDKHIPSKVGEGLGNAQYSLQQISPSIEARLERSFYSAFEDMHTTIKSRL
ncbi:CBN-CRA-1 protein [Caenorhabditis brenneri]|uniref:N-terminal acetyltransferase B complex subunit MDM20 homolog n=1 Tax=Caenorhabditis brenneri TaxID=135651 RepID=G0MEV3_CAEBE|nr:CBN-CRA-1 protein [Caenorhabditis brenneri]